MPGHFEHLHFEAKKIAGRCRFDQEIGLDRFDFQFEAKAAKKIAIRNHRRGFGMTADLAIELPLDLRHIRHVIEMPVCQQEQFRRDAFRNEPVAGAIGSIEQDRSFGRRQSQTQSKGPRGGAAQDDIARGSHGRSRLV